MCLAGVTHINVGVLYFVRTMTEQDETSLFEVVIRMDYKTQNPEKNKVVVRRRAPSMLDIKRNISNRLNPDSKTVVALVDSETGDLRFVHTMKVGDVTVHEVEG